MAPEQETTPVGDETLVHSDGATTTEADDTLILSGGAETPAPEDTVLVTDPPTDGADEAWPVAAPYRVEEPPPPVEADGATVVATSASSPAPRRRLLPEGPVAAALLAIVALVGALILGALLLQRDDGTASDEAATTLPSATDTTPVTTPTTTTSTTAEAAELPDVVGMTLATARAELAPLELRVRVARVASDEPGGTVVEQAPAAGSTAAEEQVVVLTVSRGAPAAAATVEVPDVVGNSSPDAVVVLRDAGLETRVRFADSSEAEGSVIRQAPAAETEVRRGTTVVVYVARAPQPPASTTISVPDVVGATASEARARLRELGFRVRITRTRSSEAAGTVVRQAPRASTDVRKGGTVTLTVSTGPAPVAVPDVVGLDEESARLELTDAGFEVQVSEEPTDDPEQDGVVVRQTPVGGVDAREGAIVTLVVARFD